MAERPVDEAARQNAINADGSLLVQAPAGSGKTTLLAQRYLRLLATVEAPERILALTFTRRAAEEMRERVMQALEAARAGPCPPAMNVLTWQLGCTAQRHLEDLGLDLVRHPSRLRIETIDAFNAWLAAQLPVTAGAGSRLNLTERPAPLYEEAARRALAHDESDSFGHAVEQVLALDDQRWENLTGLIAKLLPSRDRWLPLLAGDLEATAPDSEQLRKVRAQLDEDLRILASRTLKRAQEAIGSPRLGELSRLMHAAAGRTESSAAALAAWRSDGSVLRGDNDDLLRWRGVAALLLTAESTYRKRLTRSEGFPPLSDKSELLDLIAEFDRQPAVLDALAEIKTLPAPGYSDAQWARVREVAQVLVLAAAQLEQVFRERGAADFPSVAMAAVRALGAPSAPTDLNLRLDYRLQHILIDEFQDTSSAQLDLLTRLTAGWQRGDGRTVFCVGDPMQSIYGFRQAEVRAFLELADEGIGEVRFEVERLRSNFRSAAPLVEWINRCFSQILPAVDDRERGAIAFRASESARRTAPGDSWVRVRGFASRPEEAAAIADLVAGATARHPDWRIAVLVRARRHAGDIAAGLRARGVPFRAVDIEALRDRPAVRDMVTLICALLHLGDRSAWLALLRAPWAGLELADLLHVARSAPVIWEALSSDAVLTGLTTEGRIRCARVRATLEAAFRVRTHSDLARWVEQTWLALGGASCAGADELEHVGTVLARLRVLEAQGLPDAADLAAGFADLYAAHGAPAAVEIMTIHKSKGLEFDLVVLPCLDRTVPHNRDELLLSHQFARTGRDGLVLGARPAVGEDRDELFDFLRLQVRDAAGLEAERLLYVACTRAKTQLHLSATLAGRQESDRTAGAEGATMGPDPRAGSLLKVLWPVVGRDFEWSGSAAAGEPAAPRGGPLVRVPRDWVPPAAELLGAGPAAATGLRAETPVFDWAGETARQVGILVHHELQSLDLESGDRILAGHREAHYGRWLALHGVPADRLPEAVARVLEALRAVHRDARARWILHRGYRDDFREHMLSGVWQGQVVRVIFDRSFIDDAGVRWVIDYKTSHHAGGSLEQFLDREVERYRPQLHQYAALAGRLGPEAVRVGLYFPLIGAWREWSP
jgi:ATP-dependent exoDNAse (exonuclease V) beta subunit